MEDRLRHVEFKRPGRETVASSLARPGCTLALPAPATTEHGVTVAGHPARSRRILSSMPAGILVVEDDPVVATITCRVLEEASYRCTWLASGGEAIACFAGDPPVVDALVLDVRLPDISGLEVARRIRLRRPGIPILFVPGYPEQHGERSSRQRRRMQTSARTARPGRANSGRNDRSERLLERMPASRAGPGGSWVGGPTDDKAGEHRSVLGRIMIAHADQR